MIQIKNRITGLYDTKGNHGINCWTDKMHKRGVWGTLGHAKTHISQCITFYYNFNEEDIRNYLNSDFLIIDENYSVTIESISSYVISKLRAFVEKI